MLSIWLSIALSADKCTNTEKISDLERYSAAPKENEVFCYEAGGDHFFVYFHKIYHAKVIFVEYLEGDDQELNRMEYSVENPIVAYKFPSAGRVIIEADGDGSKVDFAAVSLKENCNGKIFLTTKPHDIIEIGPTKNFTAESGQNVCLFFSGFPTVKTTILNPGTSNITVTSPSLTIPSNNYAYDIAINGYIEFISSSDILILTGMEQGEPDFVYRGEVTKNGPIYFQDVQIPTHEPKYPDPNNSRTLLICLAVATIILVIIAIIVFFVCRRRGSGYTIVPKEDIPL